MSIVSQPFQVNLFDYASLDECTRVFVQEKAQSIHSRLKRTAEDIIAIGQDLIEVKARLGHGQFQGWLQVEFEMSDRHARRFMAVADKFKDKTDIMSVFPPTVLYELASPSTPDIVIKMVETGEIPATLPAIHEAKRAEAYTRGVKSDAFALAKVPKEQRLILTEKVRAGESKTVKGAILDWKKSERDIQAQSSTTKPLVTLASWENWLPQQPMCDLLITDPPYSTDIENIETFAQKWLPLALSKVRTTGRAYVCVGAYPQEIRAYLNVQVPMVLQQILVWSYKNTLGPSPTHNYKQNWQAILYFVGSDAPPLNCPVMNEQFSVQEINAPDGRVGDNYHAWQKPNELAEQLIRHSTKPGDSVIDCFAGTGTFLLVAHHQGCVARGCDISEEMLHIAEQRGCYCEK